MHCEDYSGDTDMISVSNHLESNLGSGEGSEDRERPDSASGISANQIRKESGGGRFQRLKVLENSFE